VANPFASNRATISVVPPGAYGTIKRTGRAGHGCAAAIVQLAASAKRAAIFMHWDVILVLAHVGAPG
jgi:hypothetical protein